MCGERLIVSTPVPAYWARLGPVLTKHLHEHLLSNPAIHPNPHKAVTFSDRQQDLSWKNSVLYHEYYLPAGARHQLGTLICQQGNVRVLLNCNRWNRDFSPRDRALLDLISPHVEYALRNVSVLARFREHPSSPAANGIAQYTVVFDCSASVTISFLFTGAREVLRKYFAEEPSEGRAPPEPLARWIRAQRDRLTSSDVLGGTPKPLCVHKEHSSLVLRMVQSTPAVAIVLLEERSAKSVMRAISISGFTPRENEVLQWICEGKRNSEIGLILGLGSRTVGKHLEHIFEKLGVETRTAAARAALELGRRSRA